MSMDQTPLTPPPAGPSTAGSVPAPQPWRPRARWITVVTAIVGGLALASAGGSAAVAATIDLTRTESMRQSVDVRGVTSVDLEASASEVRVEFGDVDEAELSVQGGGGSWTFRRDGYELVVRSPDTVFGWWFAGWSADNRSVVLTLPRGLEGVDASLELSAGSLDVSGSYGELDTEVSAGNLSVDASASSLDATLSAGRADLVLDRVDSAEFSVSAGDLTAELRGAAPRETLVDLSAGSADITLPSGDYAISQDVSAGNFDNRLETSPASRNSIEVTLSAGSVTLRPGR